MSFRGAPRGRGGSFGGGGGRGGGGFGGRGGTILGKGANTFGLILAGLGRGGFQQSYGPPSSVFGRYTRDADYRELTDERYRNGLFHTCL